jgi:hypothetical protein
MAGHLKFGQQRTKAVLARRFLERTLGDLGIDDRGVYGLVCLLVKRGGHKGGLVLDPACTHAHHSIGLDSFAQ